MSRLVRPLLRTAALVAVLGALAAGATGTVAAERAADRTGQETAGRSVRSGSSTGGTVGTSAIRGSSWALKATTSARLTARGSSWS